MSEREVQILLKAITEQFREKAVFPVGLQRYWEYQWILRTLQSLGASGLVEWRNARDETAEGTFAAHSAPSVGNLVDIGCGDGELFTQSLSQHSSFRVYACDPETSPELPNPTFRFAQMSAEQWCAEVAPGLEIDAAVSVSVLEHCANRFAFCAALDTLPCPVLLTCEFCRDGSDMAHCLVPLSVLTRCIGEFKYHYLARMDSCPVCAENSRDGEWRPLGLLFLPTESVR